MCGYLKSAMENMKAEDLDMTPGAYRVFHATGKDLEKLSIQMEHQRAEFNKLQESVSEVKDELADVKKDTSVTAAKVDTLNSIVVEMAQLVKQHFNSESVKAEVIGESVVTSVRNKKFWIILLFAISIFLLAGVGLYDLIVTNPKLAEAAIQAVV